MLKVRKIGFKTAHYTLRFRKIERLETKRDKKHSNAFSFINTERDRPSHMYLQSLKQTFRIKNVLSLFLLFTLSH